MMRIVIYLIGVFALAACSFRQPCVEELAGIEPYVESCPDSARVLLAQIDGRRLRSEGCLAYYNLLKTSVEDKLRVRHVSDSVMLRVVAYYQGRDPEKLQWAYYLLGRVYRDMGDSPRALKAFQQALDAFPESHRYDLLGRIYEQQFYIFSYQNLDSLALEAVKNSYRIYKIHNDSVGMALALRNQARVFDMRQQLDSMFFYYQKAYDVACAIHHEATEKYVLNEYISAYMDYGLIEQGEALLKKLPQDMKEENPITLYSLGIVHRFHHREDSMAYYFQKALRSNNLHMKSDIYKIFAARDASNGDYHQAYTKMLKHSELKDSIEQVTKTESVNKIHALYNYQHVEETNNELSLENAQAWNTVYLTIIIIIVLAGLSVKLIFWVRRIQKQTAKREKHLLDTQETIKQNSRAQLEENDKRIASLEADLSQAMDVIKAKDSQLAQIQAEKKQLLEAQEKAEQKNQLQMAESNQAIAKLEKLVQQEKEQKEDWQRRALLIKTEKEMLEFSNRKIQVNLDEKELKRQALRRSDIYLWFHDSNNWDKIRDDSSEWDELQKQITDIYPILYAIYVLGCRE